ncbi:S41 family peptidase [Sphingobacterium multivorum]|uniref:Putative CtpA-like serine protease n=1 Tax=Sphingobacterium multivorum TaxID=28454 RepID=A0A653XQU9_SPHMU|nr:S41 family peptidase [Sphingobacterium multivorum]VXC32482.1 putative CtpA-like serine protease [Sphingobacterium multivorum]
MNLAPLKQTGRLTILALIGLLVFSCKKDTPQPEPEPEPVERTEAQLIKDDIYKYYKLYSLWDKSIPDYTKDPSQFTDKYGSADLVLDALKKMTPAHAAYPNGVFDRFSYMEGLDGYNTGATASGRLKMDTNEGYGIYVQLGTEDEKTAQPIIYFVEGGSPAQKAGFKRSDFITAVNGDSDYSIAVTCTASGCTINDASARDKMMNKLNAALDAGTLKLQVKHQDGTTTIKDLTYANGYTIDPIYKDSVYTYNGNNVGYLALSSFEEIENNNINQQKIDAAFEKFQTQQIKSLIVDLRYNGGGYVDASAYVADKIGGAITKGKLMLKYEVNDYIKATPSINKMFQDTKFEGKSNLSLSKVYFLVSDRTASAAEMLINVLKPYLQVQLIASGTRTYGKPVGFFEQVVQKKVSFWPVSFLLKNSADFSDYWDGFVPDKSNITDYVFVDVGDKKETMLATALNEAAPGITTKASISAVSRKGYRTLNKSEVNIRPDRGMIKKR